MISNEMFGQAGEWETVPSIELEEDSRHKLHDFRDSYSRAANACIRMFPKQMFVPEAYEDPDAPDRPITENIADRIKEELTYSGNEFYTTEAFEWMSEAGLDKFDVLRTAKAETSAHGVFFGVLSNPSTGQTLPIAVKPCTENPKKAYFDWMSNNLIARSGRRHFAPIGFIFDAERAYSITRLEKGVETFDNTEWGYALMNIEDPDFIGQRKMLTDVGLTMADLHNDRIFHGDPQFKNIAIDPTDTTFFIDWESAQFMGSKTNPKILAKKAAHDLEILYFSMAAPEDRNGVGLLTPYDKHLQWTHFNNFILTPYIEERTKADDSDANIEVISAIESQIKNYIVNEFAVSSLKQYVRR